MMQKRKIDLVKLKRPSKGEIGRLLMIIGAIILVITSVSVRNVLRKPSDYGEVSDFVRPEEEQGSTTGDGAGEVDGGTKDDSDNQGTEKPGDDNSGDAQVPAGVTQQPSLQQPDSRPSSSQQPSVPQQPVDTGRKLIALTFDDGPSTVTTPRLLDTLKNKNVKATFFVLGTKALAAPDLARREEAEGHEVASHTPYHNQLTKLTAAQVQAEKAEMERIFTEVLGHLPPFTRPPYGSYNQTVQGVLNQPLILWSIDPRDWADRNANTVCTRVVGAARNGAIILVHDIHATTVDAVPCIIDNLRSQGYEFLTISELAKARG